MKILLRLKALIEYLGGLGDNAPVRLPAWLAPWLWGLWWAMLAFMVIVFCGQTSKFIYIDF